MAMFGGVAAAVLGGCLVPNRWLPPLPNDKFLHFAAFALLAGLALRMSSSPLESALWLLGLFGAGVAIESLQAFVPGRGFCWRDIAANAAGIACAALAYTPGMIG